MAKTITSYKDFWPFYLGEHSKPATRAFHYIGTTAFIAIVVYGCITATWWALPVAVVVVYGLAWFSHFVIEHNKPATFTYPGWSMISDFRMLGIALAGKMGAELQKYQIQPRI